MIIRLRSRKRKRVLMRKPYSMISRMPIQVKHLNRMVNTNDIDCIHNLRMDRNAFGRLCIILRQSSDLKDGKYVSVEEQITFFLGILAHHKKNSIVGFNFKRSGETISSYVHLVLRAILKLHGVLLVKPTQVDDECTDSRWKWFKGCLGALYGTYINMMVPTNDKPRYRTRKGEISTNTLAACDRNLNFSYVLAGWEGSAADSRVLRDALNRVNGLKVLKVTYYLCDNGYANSEGFLTPYKGVRYHLKKWGPGSSKPKNAQELFNLCLSMVRNVIERAFGIMKKRWAIIRSPSFYPVRVQNRLIMTCFLLHNFIRKEMSADPGELLVSENGDGGENGDGDEHGPEEEYIDFVDATDIWNIKRDEMANLMWQCRL